MAMATHVIFSAYGFWLPNDPRGSWSDFVRKWELVRFGQGTKSLISGPRSVAHVAHDRELRKAAKEELDFPPVSFTGKQALVVSQGFKTAIDEGLYTIYACAILPEHVHIVVAAASAETDADHGAPQGAGHASAAKGWPVVRGRSAGLGGSRLEGVSG